MSEQESTSAAPVGPSAPTTYWQVITTLPSEAEALELARAIIEQRDGACAQIVGPITSVYRWQGVVETSREWQCAIKTTADRYQSLAALIAARHPYDTPELIATPIVAGSPAYLSWISQETITPPSAEQ